ncbi:unnamed protein product [Psylliodes chrysocephalus]|uniref:Uncharacterized protein n=1 Tax=Psylliodes chrysocephalus TaxID=3402493 RepID=A0A9P0CS53_9CUCU|nr:unnamed protein product [Psylliodes chrysocephala]
MHCCAQALYPIVSYFKMASEAVAVTMSNKRKLKHPRTYKRNVIKKSNIEGTEYTNYGEKLDPVKTICQTSNCYKIKLCLEKVILAERQSMLYVFHSLSSKNKQDLNLQRLIEFKPIKRRRPRVKENQQESKLRQACFEYFVMKNNSRIKVCRKAFAQLHRISEKRILRITQLLVKAETPKNERGKNPKIHCIPKLVRHQIYDHI